MKQRLSGPLRVASLAAIAGISVPHYFALFKSQTGCTPLDYFTRLRMRRAGELLAGTSLNVKEVAGAMGYEDPFYFSRVFKSVHSLSPSEYRGAVVRKPVSTTSVSPSDGAGRMRASEMGSPRQTFGRAYSPCTAQAF